MPGTPNTTTTSLPYAAAGLSGAVERGDFDYSVTVKNNTGTTITFYENGSGSGTAVASPGTFNVTGRITNVTPTTVDTASDRNALTLTVTRVTLNAYGRANTNTSSPTWRDTFTPN